MITFSERKGRRFFATIGAWVKLSRIPFLVSPGIIPFTLGSCLSFPAVSQMNWSVVMIGNGGVITIMLVSFLLNEYFDYFTDLRNKSYNRYSGGSRILPSGVIERHAVLIVVAVLTVGALLIGALLQWVYHTGTLTLLLGGIGFLAGVFYTTPPLKGSYRGIGEIMIGVSCGWLTMVTGYYLQTGTVSLEISLFSIPLVLSIMAVILINEFPDYSSDRRDHKNTMVVRLSDTGAVRLYRVLLVSTMVAVVVTSVILPPPYLWCSISMLLSLPLLIKNIRAMRVQSLKNTQSLEKLCAHTALLHFTLTSAPLIVCLLSRM